MTIPTGNYLFTHYHFNGDEHAPQLAVRRNDTLAQLPLRGEALTLIFDTSQRYCTGWHNLATAESFPCPDTAVLPEQYHECRHCQQKTGFNPAFYHAASISQQQQARNQQPHILYLAHFGPGVIKVGISWAERGIRRLLDQGARSCLILCTFPNAEIARQYEAKIAALSSIVETIQVRQKRQLLNAPYDAAVATADLTRASQRIATDIGLTPEETEPLRLDHYYIGTEQFQPGRMIDLHGETKISGTFLGMIGSTLIARQDNAQYFLNISKFRGYTLTISKETEANQHAPQQASLF